MVEDDHFSPLTLPLMLPEFSSLVDAPAREPMCPLPEVEALVEALVEVVLLVLLLAWVTPASAAPKYPQPQGHVTDSAGALLMMRYRNDLIDT